MAHKIIDTINKFAISFINRHTVMNEYYKRGGGKKMEYNRQATTLHRKEVKDYQIAVTSATDPDNPRLGPWMRFQEIMKLDGHLMSCVENRILPVQCAQFKLTDRFGNEAPVEVKELLSRPWMLDMARLICMHTFQGPTLIEMIEMDECGELSKVSEIPQSNFIPQKGIIIKEEYEDTGVSYREGPLKNYYLQIGEDWNLGLFAQLGTIVLAKKLGLGAWLSYIDKYGVPPIFAITDRMDTGRRDELFDMLQNFRMNHFAVLQGNEKIETPTGYNVDAYQTFKSLMSDVADREIEKRIQGSSGLSNEKAFVGAAEVQERILKYRLQVDKLVFKYHFNKQVIPRLIKFSSVYAPLVKYNTYEYDDSETLSMKEMLEAIKSLSQYYEFDVRELVKITGFPITKIKGIIEGSPTTSGSQKKKTNVSGFSFAVGHSSPQSNDPFTGMAYAAAWDSAYERLIRNIRNGEISINELNREFILKTYDRLNKAAEKGYGNDYYNDPIARRMRQNMLEFSATKTHIQQHEIQLYSNSIENKMLYEDKSKKYLNLQNGTYLDVQASFAARSAQSARQWGEFQRDKDIYPNLKFKTMNDKDVRPAHAVLEGMIIPVDDSRIDEYTPPLDPRCRCWLEQTREGATEMLPDYRPNPEWSGNTGKTGIIFNDKNSYNKKVESEEKRRNIRMQAEQTKKYMPYNKTIKMDNSTVYVNDFADPSDLNQNIVAARKLAIELGTDIYVRHHVEGGIVLKHKNPELGIGSANKLADLKTYDGKSMLKNFIRNNIKSAAGQTAKEVVLDLSLFNGEESEISRHIKGSLMSGNREIKNVYVIRGSKVVTYMRSDIVKQKGQ